MGNAIRSVLLVDDDEAVLEVLGKTLQLRGLEAHTASTLTSAQRALRQHRLDLVVLDHHLGEQSGLDLLDEAVAVARVVMVSGYASVALAVRAMRGGASAVLVKPATIDEILHAADEEDHASPPGTLPSLQRVEWEHLQRALADSEGNVSEAARRLKLPRRTLQRKLRKLPPTA